MPTTREVADRAGVSTTTVSHVIDTTRFLPDGVRRRARPCTSELRYWLNALARSLRGGETLTFSLVLPASANLTVPRRLTTNAERFTEKIRVRAENTHTYPSGAQEHPVSLVLSESQKATEKGGPRYDRYHEICSSCQPLIQHKEDGS